MDREAKCGCSLQLLLIEHLNGKPLIQHAIEVCDPDADGVAAGLVLPKELQRVRQVNHAAALRSLMPIRAPLVNGAPNLLRAAAPASCRAGRPQRSRATRRRRISATDRTERIAAREIHANQRMLPCPDTPADGIARPRESAPWPPRRRANVPATAARHFAA